MKQAILLFLFLILKYLEILDITEAVVLTQIYFLATVLVSSSKELAILDLIGSISVFQWLTMPIFYYSNPNPVQGIELTIMQVESEQYFAYAWPGTIFFLIGLSFYSPKINFVRSQNYLLKYKKVLKVMIMTGIATSFIVDLVPLSIKFLFLILSYFFISGLTGFSLLKEKTKEDKYLIALAFFSIILKSIIFVMFGELIFVILIIGLLNIYRLKIPLIKKGLGFLVIVGFVLIIQLIKRPLRELLWIDRVTTINEVLETSQNAITIEKILNEDFLQYAIARFNNGVLVSYVVNRVPTFVPYANGSTIFDAVLGSFIPRIFWSSKEIAGQSMYHKYTGVAGTASYGISHLGEGYANFGKTGGIFYMLILGLVFSWLLYQFVCQINKHPFYIVFLPVILLHGIKVETELNRSVGFMLRIVVALYLINFVIKTLSNNKYSIY